MKKFLGVVSLLALMVTGAQSGSAAGKCSAASAAEAEQAIRYMTDLMVASSACRNTVYAEFALRNRTQIIRYQKAMIARLHGTEAFDRWDTSLANEAAQRQAAVPPDQFCQQATALLHQAAAFDIEGFRAYAASQAATGSGGASSSCSRSR